MDMQREHDCLGWERTVVLPPQRPVLFKPWLELQLLRSVFDVDVH